MKNRITERQRQIYEFIRTAIMSRGIPPTIREIGEKFGIRSTNGVEKHLQALEGRGYIIREPGKSRGIAVSGGGRSVVTVPLLGRVAAGLPVVSPENKDGDLAVDLSLFALRSAQRIFALSVQGESMIDAHILPGDTVLVKEQATAENGDIVIALVEGEATVKRFFVEANRVRLQPENKIMPPLYIERDEFRIIGKVVGVMRKI